MPRVGAAKSPALVVGRFASSAPETSTTPAAARELLVRFPEVHDGYDRDEPLIVP